MSCRGPECDSPAKRHGLCWSHVRQEQRGQRLTPLRAWLRTPRERVLEAFYQLEEIQPSQGADEFERAWKRLHMAMTRYKQTAKRGRPRPIPQCPQAQ